MLMAAPAIKGIDLFTHSRPLEQPAASGNCTFSGIVPIARKPLQAEWCLGCGVRLSVGEHGPFLQAVECCASKRTPGGRRILPRLPGGGPGERRNGLGWSRRVHFTYAPDFRKASRAEV